MKIIFYLYLILVIDAQTYEVQKVPIMQNIDCLQALDMIAQYKEDVGYFYNNKLIMGHSCSYEN